MRPVSTSKPILVSMVLAVLTTTAACRAADDAPGLPSVVTTTTSRTISAAHSLPTDDPTAARAEVRRRMVAEWNALLADIPTAHVQSQFSVDGGDTRVPILAVRFPTVPESQWQAQDSQVIAALHAHGWTDGPDVGYIEYSKGEYRMLGGCTVEDCWWEMRTAPLPPVVDTAGSEFDLPDLAGRAPSGPPSGGPSSPTG